MNTAPVAADDSYSTLLDQPLAAEPLLPDIGGFRIADAAADPLLKRLIDLALDGCEAHARADHAPGAQFLIGAGDDAGHLARIVRISRVGHVVARDLDRGLMHRQGRLSRVECADQ